MVKPANLVFQAILPLQPASWHFQDHDGNLPQQAGAEAGRDGLYHMYSWKRLTSDGAVC